MCRWRGSVGFCGSATIVGKRLFNEYEVITPTPTLPTSVVVVVVVVVVGFEDDDDDDDGGDEDESDVDGGEDNITSTKALPLLALLALLAVALALAPTYANPYNVSVVGFPNLISKGVDPKQIMTT